MEAGKLRHRVLLQSLVEAQDPSTGAITRTWADFVTDTTDHKVAADVRFLGGLESIKADATVAVSKCSIRIRYRAGVVEKMRVVHDGRNFDIKSIQPDQTGRVTLDLICESEA